MLARFDIDAEPSTPLGELGPATQTMVAIARALQDQEDASDSILVLDEPTASLPRHEVAILLDALRRYAAAGQTIVLVTHRLDEVLSVADHATLLRDGRLVDSVPVEGLSHDRLVELIMGRRIAALAAIGASTQREPLLELRGSAVALSNRSTCVSGPARSSASPGCSAPADPRSCGSCSASNTSTEGRSLSTVSSDTSGGHAMRWPPAWRTCPRTVPGTQHSPSSASTRT